MFEILYPHYSSENLYFCNKSLLKNSSCVLLAQATKNPLKAYKKAEREKTKKHVIRSLKLGGNPKEL